MIGEIKPGHSSVDIDYLVDSLTVARNDAALARRHLHQFAGVNQMLKLLLGPLIRIGRLSRILKLLLELLDLPLLITLNLPVQFTRISGGRDLSLGATALATRAQAMECVATVLYNGARL